MCGFCSKIYVCRFLFLHKWQKQQTAGKKQHQHLISTLSTYKHTHTHTRSLARTYNINNTYTLTNANDLCVPVKITVRRLALFAHTSISSLNELHYFSL